MGYAAEMQHPGSFLKDEVLSPRGLTVSSAAQLLDVGRPALSAVLNGRSALSPAMAKRFEVAFGLSAQELLKMQSEFDAGNQTAVRSAGTTRRYVIPLRQHTAAEIENWAPRNLKVRSRFPVLLRTLVHSTGGAVTRGDFPGNDDAERAGWDGLTESTAPTPWIPAGKTGWELGTNSKVGPKADQDYDKSVKAHTAGELADITFVFVTPRHWPGKAEWVRKRKAEKKWKDVRAYDSSDLEQWIEQSVPAQVWLSSELRKAAEGTLSLDEALRDWAQVTDPVLPSSLFDAALSKAQADLAAWLAAAPSELFIVGSDSPEEALGFLSVALNGPQEALARARDRTVIFKQAGVLPRVAEGLRESVVLTTSREVERELGPFTKTLHAIVIQPRNAANSRAQLTLEPLTGEAFRKALESTGLGDDHIGRLARESGRSLTVLRRRLATVPAIKTPQWASEPQKMAALAPLVLAGAWNSRTKADIEELCVLAAETDYESLELRVADACALSDPPFWMVSTFRGVTSKIDFLFAAPGAFSRQLLSRFLVTAKRVLSEDDPRLDLPDEERWAAAIHNKSRAYSNVLRDSIAETLVLLSLHGEHLFHATTGFDGKTEADRLIRELLTPLSARRLEANGRDLMAYAEASPGVFLEILEEDVRQSQPASFGLLRPADTMFGGCPRSELLWALEGLAWSEKTLHRSALILAKLATVEIKDNWSNKPISTLTSIFRPWMPQTTADHDTRVNVIKLIIRREPGVAWRLLMSLLPRGPQIGHYNHKPRWRNEGYGYGEPIRKNGPAMQFMAVVAELALDWPGGYDAAKLFDLVEVSPVLSTAYVGKIWGHVERWAGTASDEERGVVREKIRATLLGRRAKISGDRRADSAERLEGAKRIYELLLPADLVAKHAWLFKDIWFHDVEGDDAADYQARAERVLKMRTQALSEIHSALGQEGLLSVARSGKAARVVGAIAAEHLLDSAQLEAFIEMCLSSPPAPVTEREIVSGALSALNEQGRGEVLGTLRSAMPPETFCEVLKLSPFSAETWARVDELPEPERRRYWLEINPFYVEESQVTEAMTRLAAAERPRAALAVGHIFLGRLEPTFLYSLLSQIARAPHPEPGGYQLEQHWIFDAFERLNAATDLTVEQKAFLEFAYIDALWVMRQEGGDSHLVPNLERYLEEHPEFYVQALVWAFKRRDEGEDPEELRPPEHAASNLALRSYKLLESMTRLPAYRGASTASYDNLSAWITQVRARAEELARLEAADSSLGKLLAASAPGQDGVWPGELTRQAIEDIATQEVAEGARVAAFNSRGVVWRGKGGDQERELAAKYRGWAQALRYTHPFVSTAVLEGLAENYERMGKREDEEEVLRERVRT